MRILKLTDQQIEDFELGTFYVMHFWCKECELNKDDLTRKVIHKYEDIYKVFN